MPVQPARFDRITERLLGPGVRRDDLFLVGYPKSGMVWMQFLLTHALIEKRGGDRVNFLTKERLAPNIDGITASHPLNLWRFAHRRSPRVFFTHSTGDARLRRGRVLYLVRDPRDVMVSYYHFQFKLNPQFDQTMDQFLQRTDHHPCAWDAHVRHWLFETPRAARVQPVFYEQLRADTPGVLAEALRRLDVRFADRDIERAVTLSDLGAMKRIEKKYPTFRGADDRTLHARRGKAGGWREELTDAQAKLIEQRFGDTMRKLGYTPTARRAAA